MLKNQNILTTLRSVRSLDFLPVKNQNILTSFVALFLLRKNKTYSLAFVVLFLLYTIKTFKNAKFFFRRMRIKSGDKSLESLKREEKVTVCPDCGSKELDYEKGEKFCRKCGFVID